ncbi:lysosomal protective protein-like [Styela clava]
MCQHPFRTLSLLAILALLRFAENVAESVEADRIKSLPGVPTLPDFPMYSGYLDVNKDKKLHYWLNICESGTCDNLIIWFNGGPGCSSMDGLFAEHGPFKFDRDSGQLEKNNYSWNKLAHTLYIEAPVGVGFSYGSPNDPITDDTFAEDVEKAIMNFFEKFNSLRHCDIYITGESYAGVYIPTLVATMLNIGSPLIDKIKGLVIGNGLLNQRVNDESLVFYAYYHGLFGKSLWDELMENCCDDGRPDRCTFFRFSEEHCIFKVMKVMQLVTNNGLNVYNLYGDCATPSQMNRMRYFRDYYKNLFYMKMGLDLDPKRLTLVPPCSNASLITKYLNRNDVQQAIHVKQTTWQICSDHVNREYKKIYKDVSPFIKTILEEMDDIRVLLYFGDVDMACNHMGGEKFVDDLGYKITMERRTWNLEKSGTEQIGGFVKEFHKLTFLTVKGAGHMVPADIPPAAFQVVTKFLDYEPI